MSTKSNWKTFNGLARQITRNQKIQMEIMQDFAAREKLFSLIHSEIESEIEAMRKAEDYATAGYRSQLENRGESEPGSKEIDFGCGYRLHDNGPQVN